MSFSFSSRGDSIDSQYEEVQTRPYRSVSAASEQSNVSIDEINEGFYESVGPVKRPTPSNPANGEYEVIPASSSSRNKRAPSNISKAVYDQPEPSNKAASSVRTSLDKPPLGHVDVSSDPAYGLVGSPSSPVDAPPVAAYGLVGPPSVDSRPARACEFTEPRADPAYGLVGPVGAPPVPAYGLIGPSSGIVDSRPDRACDLTEPPADSSYDAVGSPSAAPTYETVGSPEGGPTGTDGGVSDSQASGKSTARNSRGARVDVPPMEEEVCADSEFGNSGVQYAQVRKENKGTKNQENNKDGVTSPSSKGGSLFRYDSLKRQPILSIISEGVAQKAYQGEEEPKLDAPSRSPPIDQNRAYAIYEMKKLLKEAEKEEQSEMGEGRPVGKKSLVDESGSAFEQLKEMLQRFQSQEAN